MKRFSIAELMAEGEDTNEAISSTGNYLQPEEKKQVTDDGGMRRVVATSQTPRAAPSSSSPADSPPPDPLSVPPWGAGSPWVQTPNQSPYGIPSVPLARPLNPQQQFLTQRTHHFSNEENQVEALCRNLVASLATAPGGGSRVANALEGFYSGRPLPPEVDSSFLAPYLQSRGYPDHSSSSMPRNPRELERFMSSSEDVLSGTSPSPASLLECLTQTQQQTSKQHSSAPPEINYPVPSNLGNLTGSGPMPPSATFIFHNLHKLKRVRTTYSSAQLLLLEDIFRSNQYVVGQERRTLAHRLGLSEAQIKVWFQNRRTKHRKQPQRRSGSSGKES